MPVGRNEQQVEASVRVEVVPQCPRDVHLAGESGDGGSVFELALTGIAQEPRRALCLQHEGIDSSVCVVVSPGEERGLRDGSRGIGGRGVSRPAEVGRVDENEGRNEQRKGGQGEVGLHHRVSHWGQVWITSGAHRGAVNRSHAPFKRDSSFWVRQSGN